MLLAVIWLCLGRADQSSTPPISQSQARDLMLEIHHDELRQAYVGTMYFNSSSVTNLIPITAGNIAKLGCQLHILDPNKDMGPQRKYLSTVLMVRAVVYGYSIQFLRKLGLSFQNTRIMSSSEHSMLPCFPYAVLYGFLSLTLARTCLATPPIPLTLSHGGCPPAVHTSAAPEHVLGHRSWQ